MHCCRQDRGGSRGLELRQFSKVKGGLGNLLKVSLLRLAPGHLVLVDKHWGKEPESVLQLAKLTTVPSPRGIQSQHTWWATAKSCGRVNLRLERFLRWSRKSASANSAPTWQTEQPDRGHAYHLGCWSAAPARECLARSARYLETREEGVSCSAKRTEKAANKG